MDNITTTQQDDFQAATSEIKARMIELGQLTMGGAPELRTAQAKLNNSVRTLEAAGKQMTQQMKRLDELIRISMLLNSTLETSELLDDIMDTVIQLTGAERAYLMLHNDQGALELSCARNWDQKSLSQEEIGISLTVIQAAMESGSAIVTTNAQIDERFGNQASVLAQGLRSIICIPLMIAGRTLGVLYADNRKASALFTTDLTPILTAFGTQAALAILNAHAYNEVKDNLSKAHKVIEELSIHVDQEKVKQQVEQITSSAYFTELAAVAKEMRRLNRD